MKSPRYLLLACLLPAATYAQLVAPPTDDAPKIHSTVLGAPVVPPELRAPKPPLTVKRATKRALSPAVVYVAVDGAGRFYHLGLPCIDPAESIALLPLVVIMHGFSVAGKSMIARG